MNHSHSTNPNPFANNHLSSSFISPSEFTPHLSSSTPLISPVNWIGVISKCFQHSSTQPLDGQSYRFYFPQINNNWLNWLNINDLSIRTVLLSTYMFLFSSTSFLYWRKFKWKKCFYITVNVANSSFFTLALKIYPWQPNTLMQPIPSPPATSTFH